MDNLDLRPNKIQTKIGQIPGTPPSQIWILHLGNPIWDKHIENQQMDIDSLIITNIVENS